MAGVSEINILSELCIAEKPAIVSLDKVRPEILTIVLVDTILKITRGDVRFNNLEGWACFVL